MTENSNTQNGVTGSSDEQRPAKTVGDLLQEVLAEMGGVEHTKIVVLASTNRLEDLDPALIRSGRFSSDVSLSVIQNAENAFWPPNGDVERPSRLRSMIDPANAYNAPVDDGQAREPRLPLEPLRFQNAFWEPNGVNMLFGDGHELPHGLPGDFVDRRSPEFEEVFRDSVRFAAGKRFRQERPDLVAVIEKHAGRKLTDDELGTAIKLGREKPADYEVMALEAQECYARLEVMFAEELAAAKS